ncbi:MAG: hypothetical protein P8R54_32535 [Myxococcota bacterium]|nr:hypothetical protein [Myxococcota bacterium]
MPALLDHLADALSLPVDAAARARFEAKIACDDLSDPAEVPRWLLDTLDALATGRRIAAWQPFDSSGDLSDQLEFFRTLDAVLPVEIEDIGGRVTRVAEAVGLEAVVVTEGYVCLVRGIGASDP